MNDDGYLKPRNKYVIIERTLMRTLLVAKGEGDQATSSGKRQELAPGDNSSGRLSGRCGSCDRSGKGGIDTDGGKDTSWMACMCSPKRGNMVPTSIDLSKRTYHKVAASPAPFLRVVLSRNFGPYLPL